MESCDLWGEFCSLNAVIKIKRSFVHVMQSSGDASIREMVQCLSKMSALWQDIQGELCNAVTDLEVQLFSFSF